MLTYELSGMRFSIVDRRDPKRKVEYVTELNMTDSLRQFLLSGERNAWIRYGPMEVYVRRASHIVGGEMTETFDIANMNIEDPRQRGQGVLGSFLCDLELLSEDPL